MQLISRKRRTDHFLDVDKEEPTISSSFNEEWLDEDTDGTDETQIIDHYRDSMGTEITAGAGPLQTCKSTGGVLTPHNVFQCDGRCHSWYSKEFLAKTVFIGTRPFRKIKGDTVVETELPVTRNFCARCWWRREFWKRLSLVLFGPLLRPIKQTLYGEQAAPEQVIPEPNWQSQQNYKPRAISSITPNRRWQPESNSKQSKDTFK